MQDFNPRPREEGDDAGKDSYKVKYISIHALVKRATHQMELAKLEENISIHALVKRATCASIDTCPVSVTISIHALVKRATRVTAQRLDKG